MNRLVVALCGCGCILVVDDALLPELEATLAAEERERANRYHFERDRSRFVVCRSSQRRILASYCDQPADQIEFTYAERGKPSLRADAVSAEISFNLSNSRDLALCAVSRGAELGVDVEKVREMRDLKQLAEHFFAASEILALDQLEGEQQLQSFFAIWTRKEAILKAVGTGLAFPLDQVVVTASPDDSRLLRFGDDTSSESWWIESLNPGLDYVGAVATRAKPASVRCLSFDPAAI